ncbi:MAG: hypothetical protein M3137_10960, partial [Actinomycetota bacterium]|nr:hypothetical protein [Actinomycetota bacterium]
APPRPAAPASPVTPARPAPAPAAAKRRSSSRTREPIPDYASLRVVEILPRLAKLSHPDLATVEAIERAGANRATVLKRISRLRAGGELRTGGDVGGSDITGGDEVPDEGAGDPGEGAGDPGERAGDPGEGAGDPEGSPRRYPPGA